MNLISPSNISGEIMTLIEEADEKVIIVSPYCKVYKWVKLQKKVENAQRKGINIEFYVRKGEYDSISEVQSLNIIPIEIENLHVKLYLNEKIGIVTSMNLHIGSDSNSLDIGYKTQTKEEYVELVSFYERYIKNNLSIQAVIDDETNKRVDTISEGKLDKVSYSRKNNWEVWSNNRILEKFEEELRTKFVNQSINRKGSASIVISALDLQHINVEIHPRLESIRIVFQIVHVDWKIREELYKVLNTKLNDVVEDRFKNYGVSWGGQMKRIKIDIHKNNYPDFFKTERTIINESLVLITSGIEVLKKCLQPYLKLKGL